MKQHLFLVLGIHLMCSTYAVRHRRQGDHHGHQHVKIRNLDAECSNTGLAVSVDFDGPFDGIVYSKGHFGNPACRYVEPNSGSQKYSFVIPSGDCGTEDATGTRSNVVIFQMDDTIQEVWDIARKVSCENSGSGVRSKPRKHGKTVVFKPLSVGMLDIQHQPFKSDGLDCWMDIQLGHFPNTSPIAGQVKIGEELSVLIYLKDDKRMYDVGVKDCWAFNNDDFDHPATSKVQLTDADGCVKKSKLIGSWMKTYEPGNSGSTTIAYTNMTAFKFPDSDNVHLTCNIEVCEDYCEETCASNSGAVVSSPKSPTRIGGASYGSTDLEPTSPSYTTTTTRPPICYPNNFDARCPKDTQVAGLPTSEDSPESEDEVLPGGYTLRTPVSQVGTTRKPLCYPGQIDPRCEPMCYPGSTDKRCYEEETDIQPGGYTTQRPFNNYPSTTLRIPAQYTTKKPLCYPGTIDPRCPPVCTPGSTDKRCNENEEDIQPGGYTTTPRAFTYPTTTYETTQRTYPTTVRTYQTTTQQTTPFQCYPGSLDPRCLRRTTTIPTTYPTTTKRPLCYPGAIDPRCPPVCTPGSTDRRCNENEEDIQPGGYTTTPRAFTYPTTTYRTTYPTTQTTPFQCYPGSLDPRCLRRTTAVPTTYPTTTRKPLCYPGAIDPRCPPVCTPGSTDTRCNQADEEERPYGGVISTRPTIPPYRTTERPTTALTTKKPLCYPGQIDPRCPKVCGPGSTDRRCLEEEKDIQPGGYTTRKPYTYPTTTYRTTPRATTTYTTQAPRTFPTTARTTTFQCYPGSLDSRCLSQTTQRPYITTKKPLCYPGQIDPRCPPVCTPGSTDKRCLEDEEDIQPGGYTTRRPFTYPTTTYRTTTRPTTTQPPRTFPTTQRTTPFQCYPGSLDPRCLRRTTTVPTTYQTTTRKPLCYPGQIDPRCPPVCTPGTTDPRCNEDEDDIQPGGYTTQRPFTYPTTYRTTTQPPRTIPTTTKKPLCYPGQIDPRCPPVCTPGSTDRRCNENEENIQPGGYTTRQPFTFPPTTYSTTRRPVTTQPPRTYPTTAQTTPFQCYPGSLDQRCLRRPTTTPRSFTTTKRPLCYPGQIDPRCPPVCTPGSTDRRCNENEEDIQPGGYTTTPRAFTYPTTTYQTTQRTYPTTVRTYPTTTQQTTPFQCYPGSLDPRCLRRTTTIPTTYPTTTRRPLCYPGQVDPRCPPVCSAGSTDPRCNEDEAEVQPGDDRASSPQTPYRPTTKATQLPPGYTYSRPQNPLSYPDEDQKASASIDRQIKTRGPICYRGSFDPRCPKSRAPVYRDYEDSDNHEQYLGFESKKISAEYF